MELIHGSYKVVLKNQDYIKKMRTTFLLKNLIHKATFVKMFLSYMKFEHIDPEDYVVAKVRGFPATEDFLEKFRIRPNAALVRNLHFRLNNYTNTDHQRKISNFMRTNQAMTEAGIFVPGCIKGTDRSCWLLPICVSNKSQFREFSKMNGLNAFRGATQIRVIPMPKKRFSMPKPQYKAPT